MSKIDNNNDYDYDQALRKKHTGQKQLITSRSEVQLQDLDQKSS